MKRAVLIVLISLSCRAAWGQYPIYPALPQAYPTMTQPMGWPPSAVYQPGMYSGYSYPGYSNPGYAYSGYSPYGYGGYGYGGYGGGYGYGGYGFGGMPYGGLNWLPPTPPSPYYVVPSGRQYLEQARRRDQATYSQLKVMNYLQK